MAIQDETEAQEHDPLNGFLRRWRRNACSAGVVSAVVTVLVAAVAVFALCTATPSYAESISHAPARLHLGTTRSLCPHCRRLVDAKIVVRDGRVYFRKRCPEHGLVEDFVCSDVAYYDRHEFCPAGQAAARLRRPLRQGLPLRLRDSTPRDTQANDHPLATAIGPQRNGPLHPHLAEEYREWSGGRD